MTKKNEFKKSFCSPSLNLCLSVGGGTSIAEKAGAVLRAQEKEEEGKHSINSPFLAGFQIVGFFPALTQPEALNSFEQVKISQRSFFFVKICTELIFTAVSGGLKEGIKLLFLFSSLLCH